MYNYASKTRHNHARHLICISSLASQICLYNKTKRALKVKHMHRFETFCYNTFVQWKITILAFSINIVRTYNLPINKPLLFFYVEEEIIRFKKDSM